MIAAALAAGNAPTDAPRSTFRIGTVSFSTAVPEGYCLPEAKDAAAAQLLAAADRDNVTHLTVNLCDEKRRWTDYFLVKTPVAALSVTTTTAEFQKVMEPYLAKELDTNALLNSASEQVSGVLGSKVDLKGRITFLGKDDTCLYLGGIFDVKGEVSGISYTLALAQCMTVVEGKLLNVIRYGEGKDAKSVEALMPSARAFAQGVTLASPQ
ncbi:hypothetical protein [Sphingomonas koreensis]